MKSSNFYKEYYFATNIIVSIGMNIGVFINENALVPKIF